MHLSNQTRTYSTWQSIPYKLVLERIVTSSTILLLPPNYKYEISLSATIDGYGAATKVFVSLVTPSGTIPILIFDADDDIIGTKKDILFSLEEEITNQSIILTQDSGTNAGMDFVINYRSTPTPTTTLTQESILKKKEIVTSYPSSKKQIETYIQNKKIHADYLLKQQKHDEYLKSKESKKK